MSNYIATIPVTLKVPNSKSVMGKKPYIKIIMDIEYEPIGATSSFEALLQANEFMAEHGDAVQAQCEDYARQILEDNYFTMKHKASDIKVTEVSDSDEADTELEPRYEEEFDDGIAVYRVYRD